ncbi:MAG: S46 family peptidase [Bacteroidota bacterium]
MKKILTLFVALFLFKGLFAFVPPDEGMWLPMLLERLNYVDMQKMGLKLTAEELYSINHNSLKDAIVGLSNDGGSPNGFFCTAEVVSGEGLLFTNHHCGYDAIQQHSSLNHDYLTDGFWATRKEEELSNEGMTASFLVRMDDVTKKILEKVSDTTSDKNRSKLIKEAMDKIVKEAKESDKYEAVVKSFFSGNEFYLFVYKTYKDVRLVGTPPSSIGKFGGDTDNWMWPRHTGDFSVMRIYTAPDGDPAVYSKDNVPLKPKYVLPISFKGVQKDDYAMIWGFPGSTQRYMTSYGVNMSIDKTDPALTTCLGKLLEVWKTDMDADKAVKLKYASKYAGMANGWKLYLGEMKQLKKLNVAGEKQKTEKEFQQWASTKPELQKKYGEVLTNISAAYTDLETKAPVLYYYSIALSRGCEALGFAQNFGTLHSALEKGSKDSKESMKKIIDELQETIKNHYKDYSASTDQKVLAVLYRLASQNLPADQLPEVFTTIQKKYHNNFDEWAQETFEESIFTDEARLNAFLKNPKFKKLDRDPIFKLSNEIQQKLMSASGAYQGAQTKLRKNERFLLAGLREMNSDRKYYPDANSTMRFTYGKVYDYIPGDAMHYDYTTHLSGVMDKEDPTNDEFIVPAKLKELYAKKDFGPYGSNGNLVTCFLTTNDITGGNSGSPVINGNGELIGIAFDGNWEAMSSNINYELELQRTICVDIRYVLFVIDKFAGAKNLIQELTIKN